jgi:hypothetical protein
MANTAKQREKTERVMAIMKGDERLLSKENYLGDLMNNLNYYNSNHDDKDKKKWFITHYATINKKVAVDLLAVDEQHFRVAGILARMLTIGSDLQEKEQAHYDKHLGKLLSQIKVRQKSQDKKDKKDAAAKDATNVISIQRRMEEKAHALAGEIDGAIDDFMLNDRRSVFSTKNYLLTNQVAGPIAKRIGDMYTPLIQELRNAYEGNDDQLVEGYSHFTRRELKRFIDFVDGIISDCQQMVQTSKANRAPRKRKEVPALKQVARMKMLREFPDLGLKSAIATTIIGSTEVWFYNTKYRRIGVYKGENGGTLSVKGTTIIGFDVKESKAYSLRKPEEFFKGLTLNKRALTAALKPLKTKPSNPNGRFNVDTILLAAF